MHWPGARIIRIPRPWSTPQGPVYSAHPAGIREADGIRVRAVYSEAVKTVGLANRLLAEKNHPQADLFWGNEELRTRQLAAQGVFRETNGVATFGHRTRRIVINTNRLALADAPRSLTELTNPVWRGKVALGSRCLERRQRISSRCVSAGAARGRLAPPFRRTRRLL